MTEVALRQEAPPTGSLVLWAESARQAATVAVSLAKTPFVPASLRDRDDNVTAANITAAILTGQEIGLSPMAALRSIDVIQGTPALRAVALRALVLMAGHDMYLVESTATRAIVRGVRKGSTREQESVWTTDRARDLGLLGKDNWRKQPAAMLVARATGECARLIAADAILGVPYAAEELDDGLVVEASPATVTSTAGRTAKRRTNQSVAIVRPEAQTTEPLPEPDLEGAPSAVGDVAPAETDAEDVISDPQLKLMQALFRGVGVTDADARHAFESRIVGREITSSTQLSIAEASQVIDALKTGEPA